MSIFNYAQAHDSVKNAPRIFGVVTDKTDLNIRYVGIKAQVIKSFNRNLALRSQGSTLDTWEYDFLAAKELDNARKSAGLKSSTAYKKYADLHWAFRSTVKDAVVEAMRRKEVGKNGLLLAIPHLDTLHTTLGSVRAKLSDMVYGAEPAVPFWECFTLVGHNDAKEPLFEKSEIWDAEEFKAYCGTRKFLRDAVKWAVSASLQDEFAPRLSLPKGAIGEAVEDILDRGVTSRMEQDEKDGKQQWDRMEFFEGGKIADFKDDMHVETCLAMVGRVVKAYNNVVSSISYDLGRSLNRDTKAGLESADTVSEVMGHTITTSLDVSTGELYIAPDMEFKAFTLELENLTYTVEKYMADWEKVLPRKYLIALGTDFNGGYVFNREDESFSKLNYELSDIAMYFDSDKFAEQREARKAYAIQAEMARIKQLKEDAQPILVK